VDIKALLKMSQQEIKDAALGLNGAREIVGSTGKSSVIVQGTVPFVLMAHMDTYYCDEPKTIIYERGRLSVPKNSVAGVGGDDRCGCWTLFKAADWERSPTLLFCEDEELCGTGSSPGLHLHDWSEYKCFVEVDGPGYGVFYSGSTSNSTLDSFMENELGLTKQLTSYNDIAEICRPGNPPGITLGAAYYNQHDASREWISEFGLVVQLEVLKQMVRVIGRLDWSVVPQVAKSRWRTGSCYSAYSHGLGHEGERVKGKKPELGEQATVKIINEPTEKHSYDYGAMGECELAPSCSGCKWEEACGYDIYAA